MKLTRERKIYAAVLALGLGVLGYDQLSSKPAAEAAAAAGDAQPTLMMATATSGATSSNKQYMAPGGSEGKSLAARLSDLAAKSGPTSPDQMRDAFAAPASWSGKGMAFGADRPAADKFVQRHKLASVATSSTGDVAVVDGQLLRVGQSLDGFKLIAVTRNGALFDAGNGVQARLTIAGGAGTASAR